jgi:starch-binding outer membrane protein, SusD/RagB family
MKKMFKNSLLVAGVIGLSFTACKNLTEKPDFASPTTFYNNDSELAAGVNGAYRPLNYEWFNSYYNRCVIDCALGTSGGYEKGPQYYERGQYVATDEYLLAFWAQIYDGVNRCNVVLNALDTKSANFSANAAKQAAGEMHFLRAMYLYQVYGVFEKIPVPTRPTEKLGVYTGNKGDAKGTALAQMITDLKAAVGELPATATDGRPSAAAARTLLAKVYLESGDFGMAKSTAEEVVNGSGLSLFADFNHTVDINHENQGERLFEIQCNFDVSPWANYNNMHAHFTPTDWDGGDPNTLAPGDGVTAAGWGDAWIVGDINWRKDLFSNAADKRIPVSFMSQYRSKNAGGDVVEWDPNAASPFIAPGSSDRKFNNVIYQKVIEYNLGGWQYTKKNYVLLRLADAYLAHAEACARLNDNAGLVTLNAIRNRAGIGDAPALTTDAVFEEWMREFAGDGWQFPLCRRFNKTAEIIQKYAGRTVDNNKFRVMPIPAAEVQSNPEIDQNDGWQ